MSQTQSAIGVSVGKRRKRYVYRLSGELKTCLIHGPGHSSDEFKVLGNFGAKCAKGKPNKDRGNHPLPRNKFNMQQEINTIVNNVVDEILLHETQTYMCCKIST